MKSYPPISIRRTWIITLPVALLFVCAGCGRPWRPTLETVRTTELPPTFALADYLALVPGSEWLYERSTPNTSPRADVTTFRRVLTETAMTEGQLVGRSVPELHPVLNRSNGPSKKERATLSTFLKGGSAFLVTFDPAIPLYPETLVPGETVQEQTKLLYYDYQGRYGYHGTVTRRVTLEGLETVETPSGMYTDCLRLRIDTEFRLDWALWADITDYVWLAAGVGEVRRIERTAGVAWIFLFDATTEYRLIRHTPAHTPSSAPLDNPRPRCSALLLERGFPRLLVGGLHHEWLPASAKASATTSQPGQDETTWQRVSPPDTQPSEAVGSGRDRRKSNVPSQPG